MITLTKNGVLHRIFVWVLGWTEQAGGAGIHAEQTNFCFFLRTMILKLPIVVIFNIVIGPLFYLALGIGMVWEWGKKKVLRNRPTTTKRYKGPSKAKVIYATVKGKICPAVVFE